MIKISKGLRSTTKSLDTYSIPLQLDPVNEHLAYK